MTVMKRITNRALDTTINQVFTRISLAPCAPSAAPHEHAHIPEIFPFASCETVVLSDMNACGFAIYVLCVAVCCWFWTLRFPPAPGHLALDRLNFRAFFPLPSPFSLFFSLWGSSRGILAAGASHDNPRTPNVHIEGSRRFKHHQNSSRTLPREGQKERKWEWERVKKREMLGSPTLRGPTPGGPIFSGVGPHLLGPHRDTHPDPIGLAKIGLARIGQIRMAKTGLAKVVQSLCARSTFRHVLPVHLPRHLRVALLAARVRLCENRQAWF